MNAPTFTSSLAVLGGRTSPATIRVEVVDGEADAATVEFSYRLPGADADTVITTLAANPAVLTTAKAGIAHELPWDFAAEPGLAGAGYHAGVTVSARLVGGSTQAVVIDLGNDPAAVQFSIPTGEADGIVPIPCSVSDSSSDVVSVKVEYRVEGEGASDWAAARPGGLDPADPTPALAIVGLQATVAGSPTVFFWDTEADLPGLERDVRLRFTVSDGVGESGSVESAVFRVDNNAAPFLTIDEGAVIEAADGIRGVPVPFHIADPEGDLVRTLFQWSRPGQAPPALGTTDPAALQRLVLDPAERRRKQICSPYRSITSGQPIPVDGLRIRLPEIAGAGHAWIWQRGFEGLELELLRPPAGAAESLTATWPTNPLRRPVATFRGTEASRGAGGVLRARRALGCGRGEVGAHDSRPGAAAFAAAGEVTTPDAKPPRTRGRGAIMGGQRFRTC